MPAGKARWPPTHALRACAHLCACLRATHMLRACVRACAPLRPQPRVAIRSWLVTLCSIGIFIHLCCYFMVSRAPYTSGLNLGAISVETDRRGFVPVNEKMEVRARGVQCAVCSVQCEREDGGARARGVQARVGK